MSPAGPSPRTPASPRRHPAHGTVALIDRASITVADLAYGPRGLRVRRFVVAFNGQADMHYMDNDAEGVAAALARVVREHGFSPRLACVGLPESMFGATLCELPRTAPAAVAALVTRRVREQIVDPSGDLLADYACIDPIVPVPGSPRRALLAWCSRAQLERHAAAFWSEGLRVRRVLPPSVALLDLFGRTRTADGSSLQLFARYCFPSLVIGVHRGRQPLYLRFLPDVMADADEGVVTTLIHEVQRTATFVTESQNGQPLASVVFSGLSAGDAVRFTSRLQNQAGLQAEPQQVLLDGPDHGADPERLAALAGLLLHGAPLARQRVRSMNLMPARTGRVSRGVATLLSVAVVSVIAALASLHVAQGTVRASTDTVHRLESGFYDLGLHAAERKALLDQAQLCGTQRATLQLLHALTGNPVQPLLETLLLIPPEESLAAASLENPCAVGSEYPRLDLRVRGESGEPDAARLAALALALQQRPWCAELRTGTRAGRTSADAGLAAEGVAIGALLR